MHDVWDLYFLHVLLEGDKIILRIDFHILQSIQLEEITHLHKLFSIYIACEIFEDVNLIHSSKN
jgi:hypothetical protein